MTAAYKFAVGAILGVSSAVVVWFLVVNMHSMFIRLSWIGLLPVVAAGLVGGFVTGRLAPRHKVVFATLVGILLALPLLAFILRHGWSDAGRDPLLWYWPMWLAPTFALGGMLARRRYCAA